MIPALARVFRNVLRASNRDGCTGTSVAIALKSPADWRSLGCQGNAIDQLKVLEKSQNSLGRGLK